MNEPTLPGRTEWETHQYLTYPLPPDAEAVIGFAAAAMESLARLREGVAEVYAATQPERAA